MTLWRCNTRTVHVMLLSLQTATYHRHYMYHVLLVSASVHTRSRYTFRLPVQAVQVPPRKCHDHGRFNRRTSVRNLRPRCTTGNGGVDRWRLGACCLFMPSLMRPYLSCICTRKKYECTYEYLVLAHIPGIAL